MNNLIKFRIKNKLDSAIIPIFVPFLGCANRCIFCAQEIQTGILEQEKYNIIKGIDKQFYLPQSLKNCEIAFYGGSFTAISIDLQLQCLAWAREKIIQHNLSSIRCSTRPDAIDELWLPELYANGLELIELGVQSFADAVLLASQRGYSQKIALAACTKLKKSKVKLGIQLMLGLPNSNPETFIKDVKIAIEFEPACLRFYPCLVIKGTELENQWQQNKFIPWGLDDTLEALTEALKLANVANIPVIRMGLAPSPELLSSIVAGPWHPALGNIVQARALFEMVRDKLHAVGAETIIKLSLSKSYQGLLAGYQGELKKKWQALGLDFKKINWQEQEEIVLEWK